MRFFNQSKEFEGYDKETWFQQDSPTCQISLEPAQEVFPGKVISYRADNNCFPRSSALAPHTIFQLK